MNTMTLPLRRLWAPILALGLALVSQATLSVAAEARYLPISSAELRYRFTQQLATSKLPATEQTAVLALWDEVSTETDATQLLEQALRAWSQMDPEFAKFYEQCQHVTAVSVPETTTILGRLTLDAFQQANAQAYLGRRLAEARLYDEALEQFSSVELARVIDPASTLFYHAVAAYEVLDLPVALSKLTILRTQTDQVPARYLTVADLMQRDLQQMEPQSLGEVARLMHDSERRLDLGRAGEQVQEVQDKIVANLDELIKKIEAQQGGGGGSGSGSSNANESSAPADDSRVKGTTAPGETDDKKFSKEGRWGDLPEKEQTAAKNLINREFPSHYRQAIETYFKKLATKPAAPGK
ncbi:hypothetical protein GC163_22375 [bacterium]|nr:hypothetical protein [bacterium]